jgi:hypothetical protein
LAGGWWLVLIFSERKVLNFYHELKSTCHINQSLKNDAYFVLNLGSHLSSGTWQGSCDRPERPDPSFIRAVQDEAGLCHLQ